MKQRLEWFLLPQHTNLCCYTAIKQSLKFNQDKYFRQWQADRLFRKGLDRSWKEIWLSLRVSRNKEFSHLALAKLFHLSCLYLVQLNNLQRL